MTPYGNFYYFLIVGVLFIPIIIAGYREKRMTFYNIFVSLVVLSMIFGSKPFQALSLFLYILWQVLLVKAYLVYRKNKNNNYIFYFSVVLSILPLLQLKILPFFEIKSVFGFLGISYLTFKSVELIMDIRDGSVKEISWKEQLAFLLFFPTISSGPIDRFKRFKKDLDNTPKKDEYHSMLYDGINKIFLGFLYKFIIAYLIHDQLMLSSFMQNHSFLSNFAYMYTYSLYLFFDFAGYSAFAIGFSYIMGIRTPENFNLPFISRNIKDFWNRWHMSLSFWFRDYVYMRFMVMMQKKKIIKDRYVVSYLGYFVLFLIQGAWHGLALHYIVYGLYHASLMSSFEWFEKFNKKRQIWKKNKFTHVLAVFITFHVICFGLLIFSGRLF